MQHDVGIHVVGFGGLGFGAWHALCVSCDWEGRPTNATQAQRDAIEHQGGTLHVRERVFKRDLDLTAGMDEMFPDAK